MHQRDGSTGAGQRLRGWPMDDDDIPVVGPTPDRARTYVAPQALPATTDHKTLEIETVRLSPEIDPRRMLTQPSLARVRAAYVSPSSVPPPVSHPSLPPGGSPATRGGGWRQLLLWGGGLGALLAAAVTLVLVVRDRIDAATFVASLGSPPSTNVSPAAADPAPMAEHRENATRIRLASSTDTPERVDLPCAFTGASGAQAAALEVSRYLTQRPSGVHDWAGDTPASGADSPPAVDGRGVTTDSMPAVPRHARPRSLF